MFRLKLFIFLFIFRDSGIVAPMERYDSLFFGPFRLDTEEKRLWQNGQETFIRPTPARVLQMLVENAPDLVSKDEIARQIWPGKFVTSVVLRVCIREIRQALGDDARKPRFIETVGRKGYRYIGDTIVSASQSQTLGEGFEYIVGRREEVAQLEQGFVRVQRGFRQVVFVTGEPGIGKTTLVELFLARLRSERRVRIGRGQCLEQYGEGEPYLPILEALGRLCRDVGGSPVQTILARSAPTWLVQMPALLSSGELASLQRRIQGANQQRMLREMADALEALTSDVPLVLVLEDLHWSDYSTIELLSYLTQRLDRIRLMIIGTYRPADLTTGHPLKKIKREMHARRQCEELPLALLSQDEVRTYVERRFPKSVVSAELTNVVYRRTEGNALFLMNVVNSLRAQIVERGGQWELPINIEELRIAESLRQLIEEKLDRFSADDRQVLEAASVEGREFSAAAIAAATGREPIDVEERCADLVRQSQFIREVEPRIWTDGSMTARYEFVHALYHEVLYGRLTPGKRVQFHQRIGERLEHGYGERAGEFAAELALHFGRGREFWRAVQYLQHAADQATQRFAYQESIDHLTKTLELLSTFPDSEERKQLELKSQISLGVALMTTKGYAAPETKRAYDRARELCQQIGQTAQFVPILWGLAAFYYVRAELTTARELSEQFLQIAKDGNDTAFLLEAHQELGGTLFNLGEFSSALQYLQQGIDLYSPQQCRSHVMLYGQDPGVSCLSHASHTLWFLGYPDQALAKCRDSIALALDLAHPHSLAYVSIFTAITYQLRGEPQRTQQQAEAGLKLAVEHGFSIWKGIGEILQGWSIALQGKAKEGVTLIERGIALWRAVGAEVSLPYYLSLLAEAHGRAEDPQKGIKILDEALAVLSRTGDRWWEAELYRLKGSLILQAKKPAGEVQDPGEDQKQTFRALIATEAETCFLKALSVARQQQAKSLELRAVVSLVQSWKKQQNVPEDQQLLLEVYNWFTEGFDSPDLQAAKALLTDSFTHEGKC